MDNTSSLQFFNKEGYPYNFQYDDTNGKWIGKLLFDENSNDTFKTICMYIFEKVNSINFSDVVDFIPLNIFNNSGITFISETYDGVDLISIENVNQSGDFFSKWVYGENLERKFPIGSIVSFSGLTGTGDYETQFPTGSTYYYTVIENKPGAILITSLIDNSYAVTPSYTVTSGVINSNNVISIPDYNQNLLGWFTGLTLYEYDSVNDSYKKLTISGSDFNDGVYNYEQSGLTTGYIQDYYISGVTGSTIDLEVTLYTERPKLYTGPIYITSGTTGVYIKFYNNINTDIFSGVTMIFEDYDGNLIANGFEYTTTSFVEEEYLTSQILNFSMEKFSQGYDKNVFNHMISMSGDCTSYFNNGDEIVLSATTFTGTVLNDSRRFKINNIFTDDGITTTYLNVGQYVIIESGNTYSISKKLKNIDTIWVNSSGAPVTETGYVAESIAFSTTNVVDFTQNIVLSGFTTSGKSYEEQIVDSFNFKNSYTLNKYGIKTYYLNGYFVTESMYDFPSASTYFSTRFFIDDDLILPTNNYCNLSGFTNKYHILLADQLVDEKYYMYESDRLSRNYHADVVLSLDNSGDEDRWFSVYFNSNSFNISYSSVSGNTSYQYETVNDFVDKYYGQFLSNGFVLSVNAYSGYTSGITLSIDAIYPNATVFQLEVSVDIFSSYTITEINRNCLIIAGNELKNPIVYNFFDTTLSTGMILSVSGSSYYPNNKDYNILGVTPTTIQLSYQGPFYEDSMVSTSFLTREFIRKPRGSYNKKIYYKFSWDSPNIQGYKISKNIFYYDFSGYQLQYTSGITYTGPLPLTGSTDNVYLNDKPNRKLEYSSSPSHQQTVFDQMVYQLEDLDSNVEYNYIPEPLQVFIGYNSPDEGVDSNIMKIEKIEYLIFSGTTSNLSGITGLDVENFIVSGDTIEYLVNDALFSFHNIGFEVGQFISMRFIDNTITGGTIFENPYNYKIVDISNRILKIDTTYYTLIPFYTSGSTFNYSIKVEPNEIALITIYGETEIEDERFAVNLRNVGVNIDPDDAYIFKEDDIQDKGIDYILLNKKRKEMLSVYTEIFNYVGSYKSLINAINYFGYNDLELYEYYRNVQPDSPLYTKLYKILIPDIFDNTIEGWNEQDWIKDKYNNESYKKTNLFNLTYKITDFWGNYLEYYSLDEVQTKLSGLVKWLRKNILPLSSNIYDITGVASVVGNVYQNFNTSNWVSKYSTDESVSSVNFNIIQTLNYGDSYFITVNFYMASGATIPDYYSATIKTFGLDGTTSQLIPVQYFDLYQVDLRSFTFEANKEVDPYIYVETIVFNDYGLGYKNDRVFNFSEGRNYVLVNNNFNLSSYKYLYSDGLYYIIVEDGNFYIYKDSSKKTTTSLVS